MPPGRWEDIQRIFEAVTARPEDERAGRLDEECGGDADLRAEVESLLLQHRDTSPEFLADEPADRSGARPGGAGDDTVLETGMRKDGGDDPNIGRRIGGFHIKSVIASGGMGTVYLAVQEKPRRRIALKLMKEGIASRSALRRFEFEAQILARLRHPNIAEVYDAGTHDEGTGGVPYFAMEYVPNARTLIEYADRKKLGTRDRLALFATICDAIHHGHLKGIIHRDLKPTNLLVDSNGALRIIDFGVARATDSDMAITTLQTDVGQLIGTLQYMSPEQCESDPEDLDVRSDVYALGVVLYELLCGTTPYDVDKHVLLEAMRIIRDDSPPRPSTINKALRGDVETIVMKALEKDRNRRYQSALDLAQDIWRYLSDRPIEARPPTTAHVFRMFAARHRTSVLAIVGIAAMLVIAVTGVLILAFMRGATNQRTGAAKERQRDATLERDEAVAEGKRLAIEVKLSAAEAARERGDLGDARRLLAGIPEAYRNERWDELGESLDQAWHTEPAPRILSMALSRDGTRIAWSSLDGEVHLWTRSGDGRIGPMSALPPYYREVVALAFNNDGTRIALGSADQNVRIWDVLSSTCTETLGGHQGPVLAVAFSWDGSLIASGCADGKVRVWDSNSHDDAQPKILDDHEGPVAAIAFSPSPEGGRTLVSGSWDGTVRIWNLSTQANVQLGEHGNRVRSLAFSPGGAYIAAGFEDRSLMVWDRTSRKLIRQTQSHGGPVLSIAFAPSCSSIASGSTDRMIRVWPLEGPFVSTPLRGHDRAVVFLGYPDPDDDNLLISSGFGDSIKLWLIGLHPDDLSEKVQDRYTISRPSR